jgi:hypothetical protein
MRAEERRPVRAVPPRFCEKKIACSPNSKSQYGLFSAATWKKNGNPR